MPAGLAAQVLIGLMLAVFGLASAHAVDQARSQARWLAATLAPAVVLGEVGSAQQALDALRHLPAVDAAWLIGPDGRPLARHEAAAPLRAARPWPATAVDACRLAPGGAGLLAWRPDRLLIGQAVDYLGLPVGQLCLSVRLQPGQGLVWLATLLVAVLGAGLGALAWQAGRAGARR